jgi:predicted porin
MKKSLLALAVLGVFAGEALAQSSSVTLFGIIDLNGRSVKNGSNKALKQMSQDGINSSRLGFRGVEDLGGGMSAGFWLEGAMNPDTGTSGGQSWQRRSTVSLLGGWGEIRLGRDYTSGFWNTTIFDPFGTNGVGAFTNVSINALGSDGGGTYVRSNNTAAYFLPGNLGGLYGQAQISAPENTSGTKQTSFRVGYAAGPFNVAVSAQTTKALPADWKHNNLAGSYNFGFASLMAQYDDQKSGSRKQKTWLLGAVVPLGQGELHAAYDKADQSGGTAAQNASDAKQFAIGYVYNLSKRTAMYGTYSQIKNEGAAAFTVGTGNGSAAGLKSTGYEVGLRHAF